MNQSVSFNRNHTSHLSSIAEENNSLLPIIVKPKSVQSYGLFGNSSRTSLNVIKQIPKKSSNSKMNSNNDHSHPLYKQYLQRVIAKTSDDHRYFQQYTHMINQQKRFIEQKLKEFLH